MSTRKLVTHRGGCHCGAVRFELQAPSDLYVYDCNCSVCTKKQNRHFIVPKSQFKLLQGEEKLTLYQFNTKVARHLFCSVCGVQAFYQPRSNPDGYGVCPHCLDPGTVTSITTEKVDGQHWEEWMSEQLQKSDNIVKRSAEV